MARPLHSFASASWTAYSFFWAVALLSCIIVAFSLLRRRSGPLTDKTGNVLPPGPKGLPILGCFTYLHQYPELSLHRWAQKYGPVLSFTIGEQRFVVLSSPRAVKDVLVTNGAIFSSRKEMFIKVQTILVHRGITASGYNEVWRKHRRIGGKPFTERAVATYGAALQFEAREMVRTLLVASQQGSVPLDPSPHASHTALNNARGPYVRDV